METPEEIEKQFRQERKDDINYALNESNALSLLTAMYIELPIVQQGELNSEVLALFKKYDKYRNAENREKNAQFKRRIYGGERYTP